MLAQENCAQCGEVRLPDQRNGEEEIVQRSKELEKLAGRSDLRPANRGCLVYVT